MEYVKFVHVLSAFAALALFAGPEVFVRAVVRTGDVAAIRACLRVQASLDPVAGGLLAVAIFTGFAAANAYRVDMLAAWMLLAYVFAAGLLALGLMVHAPRTRALLRAAEASPAGVPGPELAAALSDPRHAWAFAGSLLLWAGLVFLMVVKPFA